MKGDMRVFSPNQPTGPGSSSCNVRPSPYVSVPSPCNFLASVDWCMRPSSVDWCMLPSPSRGALKTIESVSMLITKGGRGPRRASAHTSLGFFFMLQTYLVGSRKPQNRFCVHSQPNISYSFSFI